MEVVDEMLCEVGLEYVGERDLSPVENARDSQDEMRG